MPQIEEVTVAARPNVRLASLLQRAVQGCREIKWRFVWMAVAKIVAFNAVAVPLGLWLAFCPIVAQHYLLFFPLKFGLYNQLAVDGIKPTEVYFRSTNGNQLHGLFYKKPGATFSCLFSHGNGGNVSTRSASFDGLLRHGCSVFVYDYSGYGKSEGSPSADGVIEDSQAAYDYVIKRLGWQPSRTIIYGESLGTPLSTRLAATQKCAALVLASPVYSVKRVGSETIPYFKTYPDWLWPAGGLDSSKYMSSVHVPVLFLVGSKDTLTAPPMVHELYDLANTPKQFLLIDGARHGDLELYSAPSYQAALKGLIAELKENLKV